MISRREPRNIQDVAAKFGPRPGDYPLGSVNSRAAARAMIDTRKEEERASEIQIVYVSPDGTRELGPLIKVAPPVGIRC